MNLLSTTFNAESQPWYFYIGLIAATLIAIFSMPQLIKTIKTKNTESVSLWTFILLVVGDLFFAIQGLAMLCDKELIEVGKNISSGLPLFLANIISCTSSAIVLFFKIRNMVWAKRRGITEAQLAAQYKQIKAEEKEAKLAKQMEKAKEQQEKAKDSSTDSTSTTTSVQM